jgi:CheY-like chemotaxis protein
MPGGSGLGLFISKSLTKLQGGAIGVCSEKEEGSTFAFFISTRITNPPADKVAGRAVQARLGLHRKVTGGEAMQAIKLNVLIVEDNLVNQKVLKKQLQKFGWNVSVAGNGQEALDWLQESVYWRAGEGRGANETAEDDAIAKSRHELDIILMDIEMPIMDGLTCTRLIRDYEHQGLLATPPPPSSLSRRFSACSISPIRSEFPELSHERPDKQSLRLPILAVSANARMEQIEQSLAAGMDDAISKPFRIPELWPKIRGLVKRIANIDTSEKL